MKVPLDSALVYEEVYTKSNKIGGSTYTCDREISGSQFTCPNKVERFPLGHEVQGRATNFTQRRQSWGDRVDSRASGNMGTPVSGRA